jgi:transposase InsO family protein
MQWKLHVRFGGRAGETHSMRVEQGAPVRPLHLCGHAFSRMIVGWRVASNMRTDMVLDALEMARWRRYATLEGLISHTDAGFTSIHYGEKLAELGAIPSTGSVGDCLFTGYYDWMEPERYLRNSQELAA